VLYAAEQLRDRPDVVFVFVGDGAKKKELQDIAARRDLRNVVFLPFQPREMMDQSYATADVSLVSLKRGLAGVIVPSKVYKVLASGRPCIGARAQRRGCRSTRSAYPRTSGRSRAWARDRQAGAFRRAAVRPSATSRGV